MRELSAVGRMLVINGTVYFFCLTPWYCFFFLLVLREVRLVTLSQDSEYL